MRAARRSLSSQLAVRFVHETHIAPRRFDDSTAAFRQVPPRHRSRSRAQPRTQAQGKTASAHGQREGCLAVRTRVRGRTRGGTRRRCTFHFTRLPPTSAETTHVSHVVCVRCGRGGVRATSVATYESAPPRLFDKFKWSTYLPRTKRKSSFEIHSPKQSQEMRHKKRRLHRAIIEKTR